MNKFNETIFQNNDTTIYWGDAIDVLTSAIEDDTIHLIFADPPYNIGKQFADFADKWPTDEDYLEWCYRWLDLCIQKLRPDGTLYVMSSTQSMPYFDLYLKEKLHILSRIV